MIAHVGKRAAAMALLVLALAAVLRAAVGCDLNDPDRDVKRLFPDSTGYKTLYVSIAKKGGEALLKEVEARLGDTFKGLFETADVPYTMYQIYKGQDLIGYIHGVNQKGTYGGLQVFLALDPKGVIRGFYYQKLTSKAAGPFREPAFGRQFVGLSLRDFDRYDVATGTETPPPGPVSRIQNPDPGSEADFRATLRATKKNLILVDEFLLGNKYLKSLEKMRGEVPEETLSATWAWEGKAGYAAPYVPPFYSGRLDSEISQKRSSESLRPRFQWSLPGIRAWSLPAGGIPSESATSR
jgi:hypothetical protein